MLVTTAGLPETYKGWLCAKKADVIARGEGEVLGCRAAAQGPVGYFWQDDSTRNEAERVQLYARVHETPRDLPIRWFLNEGLQLPRDIERLRATIEEHGFVLVALDSFYNVAAEIDLKDRDAGIVFAQHQDRDLRPDRLHGRVVDHMPWATDNNRKRLRGYGDVFKGAAARAGIYIDVEATSSTSRPAATTSRASSAHPPTGTPTRSSSASWTCRRSMRRSARGASSSTWPSIRETRRGRS